MIEKVIALIAEQLALEPESITLESSFEELGADSLDIVDLSMALEEEFGVEGFEETDLSSIATVGDLVNYLKEKVED